MLEQIWLIPLLPALGALLLGVPGRQFYARQEERVPSIIGVGFVAAAFLVSVSCVWAFVKGGAHPYTLVVADWISIGAFRVPIEFQLDQLSAMMILIVTGVGLLIHIYSVGYMRGDPSFYRFFCYMNLFTSAMLILVLGGNFLMMFIGWEGVGLCSYLLIGFYFDKDFAATAGKKAFVVNRIGDFGFVLGIMLIYREFGSLNYTEVFAAAPQVLEYGGVAVTCITLFLFIGAIGKSAQVPLFVWLPDAMAGPTPCSALIHAATMVTSGVYMLNRCSPLFNMAPSVLMLVAAVGVATAFLAATIGLVQKDIKKVLAYSTVSQLGYMILACGVGAYFAGAFHLMTHAFFKALLFMGAGSIIHGMGGHQDMDNYGGLRKYMPRTWLPFMAAYIAICGIPPFAGFFSKDEILFKTFTADPNIFGMWKYVFWGLGVVTAGMTAFYMSRLVFLTFYGEERFHDLKPLHDDHGDDGHGHHGGDGGFHPHESSSLMWAPLMLLGVLCFVGGWVGVPEVLGGQNHFHHWLAPVVDPAAAHHAAAPAEAGPDAGWFTTAAYAETELDPAAQAEAPPTPAAGHGAAAAEHGAHGGGVYLPQFEHVSRGAELGLMVLSVAVACSGIGVAWFFYIKNPNMPLFLSWRFKTLYATLTNKWYVDEIYETYVINSTKRFSDFLCWVDVYVVDGLVNGAAALTQELSNTSVWFDETVVDGAVNGAATRTEALALRLRTLQTGHVQNYGMAMAIGMFVLAAVYLIAA